MTKHLKSPPPPDSGPEDINLIQCGDDGWRPWSIVCNHLIDGTSRKWVPIESNNPYVEYDWVCPECDKFMDSEEYRKDTTAIVDRVQCVCVLCTQRLRAQFDPDYANELQKN